MDCQWNDIHHINAWLRSTPPQRRRRGRPQVRPGDENTPGIYGAACHKLADNGFAATILVMVARRAGVSTKTLYRLIPNKAALFEGMVSDHLDRLLSQVNRKDYVRR